MKFTDIKTEEELYKFLEPLEFAYEEVKRFTHVSTPKFIEDKCIEELAEFKEAVELYEEGTQYGKNLSFKDQTKLYENVIDEMGDMIVTTIRHHGEIRYCLPKLTDREFAFFETIMKNPFLKACLIYKVDRTIWRHSISYYGCDM